ncbi:hypothetical protein COCMIDRAFT_34694 [Bipolaris oryzae ATCC 44560]|uniref:Uncharacterized protein n=1 Tax=Bipolaris oryzae ATCC 44560 TaxID=930090 RepID=W6Z7U4_COCMI|nr:uncharacterized protein COCMIDRAFT_34694 [Bipolaris oryzae ATCC 44560]EUC47782.1 hypothetical protein COCMIDRAFT_34694 [Bipolaris oryzae ATCC 44560]
MPTQSGTRLGHKQRGSMMVPPVVRSTITTHHARRHGGRPVLKCNARDGYNTRSEWRWLWDATSRPAGAESPFDKPQRYSHPHDDGQWLWPPSSPLALAPESTNAAGTRRPPPLLPPLPPSAATPAQLPSFPACAAAWHSIVNTRAGREDASLGCAVIQYAPLPRMHRLDAATWPDADAPTRLAIHPITPSPLGHEAFRSYTVPHHVSRRHPQQNPSPRGEGLLPCRAHGTPSQACPVHYCAHPTLQPADADRPGCNRPHVCAINPPSTS